MMLRFLFFVTIFASCNAWILTVSEKYVAKRLSNNVTMKCHYDENNNGSPALSQISRIRLLKFGPGNVWKTVAKISEMNPFVVTSLSGVKASGLTGNLTSSFLSLHFDVATDDAIGRFQCEIDGYDVHEELEAIKTDPVVVTERSVSYDDILDIIMNMKAESKDDHGTIEVRLGLLETAIRAFESQGKSRNSAIASLTNRVNMLSSDFLKVTDDLLNKQKKILSDLKLIKQVTNVQRWPEGNYALMKPTKGCPYSNTFNWADSNIRITTQQGNINIDALSSPNHFKGPVKQDNGNYRYLNMRFCSRTVASAGPAWPKGKYCVVQHTANKCPPNLSSGFITFDRENIGSYDTVNNLPSAYVNADITRVKYCCRNDSNADTPILLPARSPFYLYRYGGKCQQVIGMDVTNEWMFFDTKETSDARDTAGFHPDSTIKNIRLELCYYTPRV